MKILFYLAIVGAIGIAVLIYLEKTKKTTNTLIDVSKDNKTDNNIKTNNPPHTE